MNIFNILSESILNQKPNINNSIAAGRKKLQEIGESMT